MQIIKVKSIPTQGRMSVDEIQTAMAEFDGKSAPCDRKYTRYQPVKTDPINLLEFVTDLKYILEANNEVRG